MTTVSWYACTACNKVCSVYTPQAPTYGATVPMLSRCHDVPVEWRQAPQVLGTKIEGKA